MPSSSAARRGVLAEPGRAAGGATGLADDARERRLLAQRPDHRIVDGHEVAPGGMCGSAKMSAAVYAVATGTSCATQRSSISRAASVDVHVGDDAVDLVAVRGAVGELA